MSNKNLIASFIAIGMAIWLFSGDLGSTVLTADEDISPDPDQAITSLAHVRAMQSHSSVRRLFLEVSGQTQANRIVNVKAEVSGRVEEIAVEKGAKVSAGDLLCKIAVDTRQSDVDQAKAELMSAKLEYAGILDLKRRGLQSDINVAKTKARLEGSRARSKRAALALQKTHIRAPFSGVVENQSVEIGDFLNVGHNCVTLIEIDPMLVIGHVAEKSINDVTLGGLVDVVLITGEVLKGEVTFIARSPEATTRTYPIEVTVKEPSDNMRAGMTAHMKLPFGEEAAHLISSASLVLDDAGVMGVRIVDQVNIVHFKPVTVLAEGSDGVWVSGLAEQENLITVGHEEVFEGQRVKIDLTRLGELVGR